VSGSGIASAASVGPGDEGSEGNAVNVNGDSGDIGKGWMVEGMGVVEARGFSFAWRGEPNVRGLGVRVEGAGAASGCRGVVVGGEGGVEGGAVAAGAIECDNFDDASGP
jgi:hypothetical protein